jgi:hypothetical protein
MRHARVPSVPLAVGPLIVLAMLTAAPVARAEEPPARKPPATTEDGRATEHRTVGTGAGGCALEISAGPGSILDKDELILKDYVDIRCGALRLQADLVRYVPSTHQAHAEGNIILDQAQSRITADTLDYNLQSQTGVFLHARGYAEPSIFFQADRVEQISKDELELTDATFTACTQPTPYWSFKLKHGLLRLDDYAYLHDLQFKAGPVTVFYSPYLVWPIKTDRASGLLFPEFGFSQRSGTIVSDAWYWAIRRNMDATFYLDYTSKSGIGNGLQYRYVPNAVSHGQFTGYFIRDQVAKEEKRPGVPFERWVINYAHQQELAPEWRLVASANFVSDFNYYLDFERDIRLATNPQAVSNIYLTHNWGFSSLNMWAERREQLVQTTLLPTLYGEPFFTIRQDTVVRWIEPEVELRSSRQRLGNSPLFLSLEASFDNFDKGLQQGVYQRADAAPVLSSQLSPVPWLDINASAGVRGTYYTKSERTDLGCDNTAETGDFGENNGMLDEERDHPDPITGLTGTFGPEDDLGCDDIAGTGDFGEGNGVRDTERIGIVDDDFYRRIYQGGLTLIGPKISRVFEKPDSTFSTQLKNSIEPTLTFSYQSAVSDPQQIIQFDEIDTIAGNTNRLTYGVTSRLFAKRPSLSPSEMADASMGGHLASGGPDQGLAEALEKMRRDQAAKASHAAGAEAAAAGEEGATGDDAARRPVSTVEIATFELSQDYSFLGPLSVSGALGESRPVSPIRGSLRINPSIYTSIDMRTSFDVLFRQIRDASLSANLRLPGLGFLDATWTTVRDLDGRALFDQGLAPLSPFNRSQIVLQGETSLFARRVLLGFQSNYELGDVLPNEPRLREQRYRAGYNTQCCGFQFEFLNRNYSGSELQEFRFLINLKGVGNVIDLHETTNGGY